MPSRLKILMTTDAYGDINAYTTSLCDILVSLTDAEILLVSTKADGQEPYESENIKRIFSDVDLQWTGNFESYKHRSESYNEFVKKNIDKFKPNIIHLNHYINPDNQDSPTILTAHEDVLNQIKWTKRKGRAYLIDSHLLKYRDLVKENLKMPNCIVTLSKFNAQNLLRTYEVSNKIKVIYSGISSKFKEKENEAISLMTCVNNDKEAGNFNMFLKTILKLPENVQISVIEHNYNERQPSSRINYFSNPNHEELTNICCNSDIYLDLSNWDTFGTVPMVAAFSKCAIVANDIPFLRELWGDCACLFERNNVNSLMRYLNNLIENRQYMNMVSQKCYNKAISVFNSKRMGFEYINLYKQFIK